LIPRFSAMTLMRQRDKRGNGFRGAHVLEAAGLTTVEESTYLALLGRGPASPESLAGWLEMPPRRVLRVVNSLVRHGLAQRTPPPGQTIMAVPADLAVERLIARRHQELEQVRQNMGRLMAAALTQEHIAGANDLVEVIESRQAVQQTFERLQHIASHEVRTLVAPPYASTGTANETEFRRLAAGVRYRAVYDESALAEPGFVASIAPYLAAGEDARLVATIPIKLVVADRALTMLPLTWTSAAREAAVLVRPSGLLDALIALFEVVWANATPLTLTGRDTIDSRVELSGTDRQLLSLLVSGLTDDAAGARLGMSRRTVVRRVHHLMTVSGARSRLQLGWHARERGWL
jgi:DNA-binding CsgD family transcriptional regulator